MNYNNNNNSSAGQSWRLRTVVVLEPYRPIDKNRNFVQLYYYDRINLYTYKVSQKNER